MHVQGDLAQLDSQNPVLYMDFPQGRLKFYGTIIFPKTNYMLLKVGQKDVLCEDIFENMVSRLPSCAQDGQTCAGPLLRGNASLPHQRFADSSMLTIVMAQSADWHKRGESGREAATNAC